MIIDVTHECSEGWHTFTSTQFPGLFVTGQQQDLEDLYAEVPLVIAALAKSDFDKHISVTPVQTYSDYAAGLPVTHRAVSHYEIRDLAA